MVKIRFSTCSALAAAVAVGLALAGADARAAVGRVAQECLPIGNLEFGPYDYRAAPPEYLGRVERFHFNGDVETLRKGQSSVNIGEDLEFVLRYFPNHHRALNSMLKLGQREHTNLPRGNRDTVDCWFERASTFKPDDGTVSLLYALWLTQRGDRGGAAKQLELASANAPQPTSANFAYNLGLAYLEVGDYEHALAAAHTAYAMGYTLPGLRERLRRAGKWRPDENAPAAPPERPPADGAQATGAPPAASGEKP